MVLTFTDPRNLAAYQRRFASPLTVVTDPDRHLYRALGFGRGSIGRVWGWRAGIRYLRLLTSGGRLQRHDGTDTLQLGGNVVVARTGQLHWRYQGAGPDDRPTVDELLANVRAAAAGPPLEG